MPPIIRLTRYQVFNNDMGGIDNITTKFQAEQ
jgi:hypothetical protein